MNRFAKLRSPIKATILLVASLAVFFGNSSIAQNSNVIPRLQFNEYADAKTSYTNGMAAAKRDLSASILSIKSYGLPAPWAMEYERLLERRCSTKVDWVAGCAVKFGLVEFVRGYNGVTKRVVEQKYGTNIWKNLQAEAEQAWNRNFKPEDTKSPKPSERRVRVGDTLSHIAKQHGVTLKSLQEANRGLDPSKLQINQAIVIPVRDER